MTTTVTVRPAGHHLRITTLGQNERKDYLKPGDPERNFYAHTAAKVLVEEIDLATFEAETAPPEEVTEAETEEA